MRNIVPFNSIRYRMLSGFLILSFVMVVLAFVSLYVVDKNREVLQIHGSINELQVYNLNLIKIQNEYLNNGCVQVISATFNFCKNTVFGV